MDKTPKPFKDLPVEIKIEMCIQYAVSLFILSLLVFFIIWIIITPSPSGNPILKVANFGKHNAVVLYDSGKSKVKEKIKEFHKELHDSP